MQERKFDGLISRALIEMMPFEEVKYWPEMTRILDWSRTHVHSSFHICWGAQAALYHFHGVPKHALPTKRFGVYRHHVIERHDQHRAPLMRGFDDYFLVPVSRHTEVRAADLPPNSGLEILAASNAAGLCLLHEPEHRTVYMFNHLEYDTYTLHDEYCRDRATRQDVSVPINYYPDDDPEKAPRNCWRATRICCSATGSTRCTRPRPTSWRGSARPRRLRRPERAPRGTSSHSAQRRQRPVQRLCGHVLVLDLEVDPLRTGMPGPGHEPAQHGPAMAPALDGTAVRSVKIPASSPSTTHRPPATGWLPSNRTANTCGRRMRANSSARARRAAGPSTGRRRHSLPAAWAWSEARSAALARLDAGRVEQKDGNRGSRA